MIRYDAVWLAMMEHGGSGACEVLRNQTLVCCVVQNSSAVTADNH